jgi:uncharacterized membrane protein YoaK (UPF0700 family)
MELKELSLLEGKSEMSNTSANVRGTEFPAGSLETKARDVRFDPSARKAVVLRNRILVGLSVSAGVVDMIAFLTLGKVFTAFQTGNLVFLGLGIVGKGPQGLPLPNPLWVIASILSFAVGAMVSARIVRPEESEVTAWPRRVTFALVITAVSQVAFLIGWIATSGHPTAAAGATLVAIMAFGMGVQITAARSLRVPDVSTTAATATLVTFVGDIATNTLRGKDRFLRLQSMVAMILGAAAGTYLVDNARLYVPVVPLIITLIAIAIASVALKGKPAEPTSAE